MAARYDKRFLSNSELQGWYTPGDRAVTFEIDGYSFGCAICIETQFPEIFSAYEKLGVDAIVFPSYSLPRFFQIATQAHAGHNCMWIAASVCAQSARKGPAGIAGPDGEWIVQCSFEQNMVICELDRDDPAFNIPLKKARPWRAAARRGDIYRNKMIDA